MIELELVINDHDWLTPLLPGPVEVGPFRFSLDRKSGLARLGRDDSTAGGEGSLAAHLLRVAAGDRALVAAPLFLVRRFRHRCFYVLQDSPLARLEELRGRRVGISGWSTTGNTWSREALREAGVDTAEVDWVLEGPPPDQTLPRQVTPAAGTGLELLATGSLDALVSGDPFLQLRRDLPRIRHLLPDPIQAELDYYRRTRVFPAHHVLLLRRRVWERWPETLHALHGLLSRARVEWFESRWRMADEDSPFGSRDVERSVDVFRGSWYRDGFDHEENARMVRALARQQELEGLAPRAVEPDEAFQEFLEA